MNELLNPKRYAAFKRLELLAHSVVEGFKTGLHKSPYKGFAVEFEQHRPYVPGDDLKHLDWKLMAKSDRYYIKQYEEDTSLRGYLILDTSGSMGYTSQKYSKLDYGKFLLGVFSYLMLSQQDSVGMVTCDNKIQNFMSPHSSAKHLRNMMEVLNGVKPGEDTGLANVLQALAGKIKKRALIVIISDFFEDTSELKKALNHFAHKKHEVILYQILDRKEAEFPFSDLTQFESLEGQELQMTDPVRIRKAYLTEFNKHKSNLKKACFNLRIDFQQLYTDEPFERTVASYLAGRLKK